MATIVFNAGLETWKAPFFGCSNILEGCCHYYCGLGYLESRLVWNDSQGTGCCNSWCWQSAAFDFCALACGLPVPIGTVINGMKMRQAIRVLYGIRSDDGCPDCCAACFCPVCTVAQAFTELEMRKNRPHSCLTSGDPPAFQNATATMIMPGAMIVMQQPAPMPQPMYGGQQQQPMYGGQQQPMYAGQQQPMYVQQQQQQPGYYQAQPQPIPQGYVEPAKPQQV